jgi:tetratricopeptide (TPR) repeat protein
VPSAQLFDWLEKRAGSNALFFEELLQWLLAQGFTQAKHGELELVRVPKEIEIPRSAESTIEKRLDRLDEETRRILEYASVGGAEFDSVTLAQLLEADELELEENLEPIARLHRLIVLRETRDLPNGDIASVYTFAHALIHDVLHKGLQGKRRILLHRKMAQILEELYERDRAGVAARLAVHAEEGRLGEKAFEYALIAASKATRLYAHWDALDQIERAVRNAPDDPRQSQAYQHLGEQLLRLARYPEAITAFQEALQRTPAEQDAPRVLELKHRCLLAERDQGQRPVGDVLADFQALREEARRIGARREECRILWNLIDLPGTSESMDVHLAEEALLLAQQEQAPELLARSRHMLGLSLTFNGEPERATEELAQAAAGYAALGDRAREASCHNNIAVAQVFLGRFAAAGEAFAATMRIFDELVDPARSAAARSNLGYLLRVLGEYERAETLLLESVRIAERLEAPVRMLPPVQNLAELHEARGEWAAAERAWRQLLELSIRTGYAGEQVIAHCGIGTARLRQHDLEGARQAERDARALLGGDPESLSESGEALLLFSARLAAASGELEGALGLLDRLQNEVDGRDPYLGGVCRLEKALLMRNAHPDRAAELAESARARFAELGAKPAERNAVALLENLGAGVRLSA